MATFAAIRRCNLVSIIAAVVVLLAPVIAADWARFASHLRCPFSQLWLEHGPEAALRIIDERHGGALLGDAQSRPGSPQRRRLAQAGDLLGSCSFTNPFTGTADCTELRGDSWTPESAAVRCNSILPGASGTLVEGEPCQLPSTLAGWYGPENFKCSTK